MLYWLFMKLEHEKLDKWYEAAVEIVVSTIEQNTTILLPVQITLRAEQMFTRKHVYW